MNEKLAMFLFFAITIVGTALLLLPFVYLIGGML